MSRRQRRKQRNEPSVVDLLVDSVTTLLEGVVLGTGAALLHKHAIPVTILDAAARQRGVCPIHGYVGQGAVCARCGPAVEPGRKPPARRPRQQPAQEPPKQLKPPPETYDLTLDKDGVYTWPSGENPRTR
jgi:hypothetical protein